MKKNILFRFLFIIAIIFVHKIVFSQNTPYSYVTIVKIETNVICDACKNIFEKKLTFENGVSAVSVDLNSNVVSITYSPENTNPEKLRIAISNFGYDADNVPANIEAYKKLPEYCKQLNVMDKL